MAIRQVRAGRRQVPNVNTYVGEKGVIFYDEDTGTLRLSDGVTPGGINNVLPVATSTQLGAIKAGAGVNITSEGEITIDASGLPVGFGDFFAYVAPGPTSANAAYLSSVVTNEDIVIQSNGTGSISVEGEFNIFATDGPLMSRDPSFQVLADGQLFIKVPATDNTAGAVEIIGSSTGNIIAPGIVGAMLHVTGQVDQDCRLYFDGNGGYASLVGRRWNGNVAVPTQVLANEDILRINATAATNAGVGNVSVAQIRFTASENQTTTAQGSRIEFWTTAMGNTASNRVLVSNITVENGVSATKFTGPVLQNGNSNVSITSNSNVSVHVNGNATARAVFTSTGANIAGYATATGMVTAQNYSGQARDAGTLGAAGTLTIDFATDHMVLVNLTTTATIAFSNITAGKTVTVLVKNATGQNRAVTLGVVAGNTTGGNPAPNVNDGRTGMFVYRTFGTATTDVYCEVN